jgi:hypothetical protein
MIEDFIKSNDAGWDVTRAAFLVKLLEEIANPDNEDVLLVIQGKSTYLIRRSMITCRVKKEQSETANDLHSEQVA